MASLNFSQVVNLTEASGNVEPLLVETPYMADEPNGQTHIFYKQNDIAFDKGTTIGNSDWADLVWDTPQSSITTRHVQRIGVKNFPQIGAMAFYKLRHQDTSKLVCPVFVKPVRDKAPVFTLVRNTDGTITFTMSSPEEIEYTCWRIVMQDGETAFEYISYETEITVNQPYLPGTYDCHCVGYVGEGQRVSEDSNYITTVIEEEGIPPAASADLYTTDIQVTKDGKIKIIRSDGVTKESEVLPDIYPTGATFQEDGKLKITLNNGTSITTDNVAPGSGGNYVTTEQMEAAIQAAIYDSWEAEY